MSLEFEQVKSNGHILVDADVYLLMKSYSQRNGTLYKCIN